MSNYKKRTKRLLLFLSTAPTIQAMAGIYPLAQEQKSFASFLQKRRFFLAYLTANGPFSLTIVQFSHAAKVTQAR